LLTPQNLQAPPQAEPTAQARQILATVQHACRCVQTGTRRDAGRTQWLCERLQGAALAPCPQRREKRRVNWSAGVGRAHQCIVEAAGQVHGKVTFRAPIAAQRDCLSI